MKKIQIFASIILIAVFSACSSFLEEVNPTAITGVYETEALLEANLAGVTPGHFFRQTFLERFGSASGMTTWGMTGESTYSKNDYTYCMNFTVLSTASENRNMFIGLYRIIQRVNLILANLPGSPVKDSYKREVEAECCFLRGIAYYNLARYYGDVPLRLSVPNAEDATSCPCSPYYKVYEQAVKDFKFAEQYMRSPERAREVSPVDFRPNRYAATAYLSCLYTHIGSLLAHPDDNFWDETKPERVPDFSAIGVSSAEDAYRLALEYAEKVIPESPTHEPDCRYALVEKIGDLYQFTPEFSRNGYTSWNNPEQIMVTSSSIESANTDYFTRNTVPNYCPGTEQLTNSDNTARTRCSRFLFEKWCSTYPGEMGIGTFKQVHITSADPRLKATIWYGNITLSTGATITTYPYANTMNRPSSMPYYKKYWCSRFAGSYGDCDYYDLRLGEIYLNAAEAAAWLNDETKARQYMEVLHARARHSVPDGEADSNMPDWGERTFANRNELIEAIFWERMFELAGEGHDFTDTHRFGARWLSNVVAKPLNQFYSLAVNQPLFGKIYQTDILFQEDRDLLRKSLLTPLPTTETDSNSGVDGHMDFTWGL